MVYDLVRESLWCGDCPIGKRAHSVQVCVEAKRLVPGRKGGRLRSSGRLVVVSNRVPTTAFPASDEERRTQPVGGLVSAVRAALESHTGMWFGWSGTTTERRTSSTPDISEIGPIKLVRHRFQIDVDGID